MQAAFPQKKGQSNLGKVLLFAAIVLLGLCLMFVVLKSTNRSERSIAAPRESPQQEKYHNENYKVPDTDLNPPQLPIPRNDTAARSWLTDNNLYRQTVSKPIRCELGQFNYQSASSEQQREHANEVVSCLMRLWGPTLESAGYQPVRPQVTVYSQPTKYRCGKLAMRNAAYCAGDQQIYVASDIQQAIPARHSQRRFMIETVIAHEFGHAVQARSGMLAAELVLERDAPSTGEQHELSRRLELQADCFAGLFLDSIAQSTRMTNAEREPLSDLIYSLGDDILTGDPNIDDAHGSGANRKIWFELGMSSDAAATCNSFNAAAGKVR